MNQNKFGSHSGPHGTKLHVAARRPVFGADASLGALCDDLSTQACNTTMTNRIRSLLTVLVLGLTQPAIADDWLIEAAMISDSVFEPAVRIYADGRTANMLQLSQEQACVDGVVAPLSLELLSQHIAAIPASIPNRSALHVATTCSHDPQRRFKISSGKVSRAFTTAHIEACFRADTPDWLVKLSTEVFNHYRKIQDCEPASGGAPDNGQ